MKNQAQDPLEALFASVPLEQLDFSHRVRSELKRRNWALRSGLAGGLLAASLTLALLFLPRPSKGSFLPPEQLDAYVTSITSLTPSFADVAVASAESDD